jgi:hypothetical protein
MRNQQESQQAITRDHFHDVSGFVFGGVQAKYGS